MTGKTDELVIRFAMILLCFVDKIFCGILELDGQNIVFNRDLITSW